MKNYIKDIKNTVRYVALLTEDDGEYVEVCGVNYERLPIIINNIYFEESKNGLLNKVPIVFNESKSEWGDVIAVSICEKKHKKRGAIFRWTQPRKVSKNTVVYFVEGGFEITCSKEEKFI